MRLEVVLDASGMGRTAGGGTGCNCESREISIVAYLLGGVACGWRWHWMIHVVAHLLGWGAQLEVALDDVIVRVEKFP